MTRQVKAADGSAAVVLVQRGLDDMEDAQHTVARGLLYGVPVLILLTAVVTWVVVGRVLVPVRQAQERERRFTADAAHELRSPLPRSGNRPRSPSSIRRDRSARARGLAVVGESVRLQRIVDDLLLLARLDEGTPGARVEVDLDDLVLEEATRLRAIAAAAHRTRGVGAAPRARATASQLERLVRNLCDNAARYARASIVARGRLPQRRCAAHGRRRRAGRSRRGSRPSLRPLRPIRRGARPALRRHRPRSGDRPGDRARARRRGRARRGAPRRFARERAATRRAEGSELLGSEAAGRRGRCRPRPGSTRRDS